MTEFAQGPSIHERRAAHAEHAHRPGGVLHEVAKSAITQETELHPEDVGNIIMPPKRPEEKYDARWELIEGAGETVKNAAGLNAEEVLRHAELLDLRKPESIDESDIQRIDPQRAVWMIEGGANRTSVVRRTLILEAMRRVYGDQVTRQTVYQFGSDRPIRRMRKTMEEDPGTGEMREVEKPNAEYKVAQEIAGDHLPEGDSLTEFGLNLSSALQSGYEVASQVEDASLPDVVEQILILRRDDSPQLVMIQPKKEKGGLIDGINAAHEIVASELAGQFVAEPYMQPVIATNGQYRAKDELQADSWAREKGVSILPPVALGDEPGYTVVHDGKEIVTGERAPMAYINEIVILHRLNSQA